MSHTSLTSLSPCGQKQLICLQLAVFFAVLSTVTSQMIQLPFPDVPNTLKLEAEKLRISSFVNLWKFSEKNDGATKGPSVRINIEPKTILAPSDLVIMNLIPQDVVNPFYSKEPGTDIFRKDFITNHLGLDPVDLNDPQINTTRGLMMRTLSGKELFIKRDASNELVAVSHNPPHTVEIRRASALNDGSFVYELQDYLFDSKSRAIAEINRGNEELLRGPLGPPLDLTPFTPFTNILHLESLPPGVFPPAAPDSNVVFPQGPPRFLSGPPAPPLDSELRNFGPPAPPQRSAVFEPHAPPRKSAFGPPAPPFRSAFGPPAAPQRSGFGPPAAPQRLSFKPVVVPQRSDFGPPAAPQRSDLGPPATPIELNRLNDDFGQVRQQQRQHRRA